MIASVYFRSGDVHDELKAMQGQVNAAAVEFMNDTPMWELYQRVAPRPEDFPRLLDRIGAMTAEGFDYTEELRGIQVPTMLVAADADQAPPSAFADAFKLGLTHYSIFASPLFAAVTLDFLDGPS